MTGKERILAAMDRKSVDHLAFMPITMMFAADTIGVPYGRYASDHTVLVDAQCAVAERYGTDHVSVISDPAREAAALGGTIEWFADQPPAINEAQALLTEKAKLSQLKIPDPYAPGRLLDRVEGVRLLKRRVGNDLMIEGWVEGPCAQAADLRGLNTLMLDFYDDPTFVEDLFTFVIEMELRFAKAQIEAGADLIGVGDAAASLVGPKLYRQFVQPWETKLVKGLQDMGARVRLHICGNTRQILAGMGATGADMIDLDYPSPIAEGRAAMGQDAILSGNLDPVRAVRDGSPQSIQAALQGCLDAAGPHYIVCAGCEIPRGTPPEHLLAMRNFALSRH